MEDKYTIDKKLNEFNKEGSNDCVLGEYLKVFADNLFSSSTKRMDANKKADKEITEWVKQALQEAFKRGYVAGMKNGKGCDNK